MQPAAIKNREELYKIRAALVSGAITYDQAKLLAAPILIAVNARGKEIAKKYGKRHTPVTFAGVMR